MTKLKSYFTSIDWLKWVLVFGVFVIAVITRWVVPTTPSKNFVFDEVYFVPQTESYAVNRYYYDPHPPLARIIMYYGMKLFNPNASNLLNPDLLQNKVDSYKTPLNLEGIRFFPKVFGTLVPILVFLLTFELVNWRKRRYVTLGGYLIPLVIGLMAAFENTLIVESRYALLSQIMIGFMLVTCLFALLYYKYRRDNELKTYTKKLKSVCLWLTTALLLGCAVSTKWLALSIAPFVLILLWWADLKFSGYKRNWRKMAVATVNVLIVCYVAFLVYLGVFAWHFNKIQHYSPSAEETVMSYQEDLKNGTSDTTFWTKLTDWFRLEANYEKGVPALDYSKSDEIGSMWITWPVMARPINYYWERDEQGMIRTIMLIGNPVVWAIGLLGIITLSGLGIASLFGKNGFGAKHFLLVMLYFANWLPYALITRVMYMYHYMPALVISIIIWGVVLYDFVLPRLREVLNNAKAEALKYRLISQLTFVKPTLKPLWNKDAIVMLVSVVTLFVTMFGFYFYAPMTYMLPLNQQQFEQRILLKEWNVKWP